MATTLSKDQILQSNDLPMELVPVPEWGGDVWVRGMKGTERDAFEASVVTFKSKGNTDLNMKDVRAKLAAYCICDENGVRLFTDKEVMALSGKSASALQRIFKVGQKLSGIGDDDIKELTEGIKTNPSEDSASA
jgi:hypothetical protein